MQIQEYLLATRDSNGRWLKAAEIQAQPCHRASGKKYINAPCQWLLNQLISIATAPIATSITTIAKPPRPTHKELVREC
jgi:hypothetical protein